MIRHYLHQITVLRLERNGPRALLVAGALRMACRIGRAGATFDKREGDGRTPRTPMRILSGYWRADRRRPPSTGIAMRPIRKDDGWCDAPGHGAYNRPVRLPFGASHEVMMRPDHQYDVVLDLDWNRSVRRQGRGSAIFLHLMSEEGQQARRINATGGGTAGCVAVPPERIDALMALIGPRTRIIIR